MTQKNNKIVMYDFIGKEIKITASECDSLVGKEGLILDETKNMFILESGDKQIKLTKNQITFKIKGLDYEIEGKSISKASDERIKLHK